MLIDYHDYMSKNLIQFWDIGLENFSDNFSQLTMKTVD